MGVWWQSKLSNDMPKNTLVSNLVKNNLKKPLHLGGGKISEWPKMVWEGAKPG